MVGFTTRSALWACCCVLPLFVITCLAQVPPGVPIISGTQVIIQGNTITLTCTVTGGDPSPSVKWLRDDVIIDDSYTQNGNTVQNNYTFVASAKEHLAVFECQSENGVLQNPLSRTKFVEVYKPPSDPVLTGPTDFLSGTPGTWTCTTTGAYPVPTMKMRIENSEFADPQFTSTPAYDVSQANFNVTGTLTWSPTTANDKQKIYCDVYHPQTGDDVRTADLQLNVGSPLAVNAPQTLYETNTGKTITLQCVVTSGTATQIRWYKNNRQLNLAANFRLTGGNPNNPSLTIANVLMSDAGNYLCEATDGTATKNTSVITVTTKASPTTPVLTGPSSVTSGNTKTWTCVSKGGNPQPTMTMRIGNRAFSSELTVNSVLDSTTNTYDVTGTLSWAPQSTDNNGIIYCDVTHETLDAPQTVNLPLTVNTPPQPPTLTGPTDVKSGTPYTWTCTSVGAFPEQTMNLRLGNTPISNGVSTNSIFDQGSKLYTVTSTLSWTPSSNNAGNTLFCDVFHPETLGQTPQTANLPLNIQSQPQTPTLTGPSEVVSGTTETWTCVSKGGNPSPTMSMRIGNTIFNNELSVSSVLDQSTNSYTVTGTLQWAPNGQHNQQILHCDVSHPETLGNTPQTVDLPLTVKSSPQRPTISGPNTVISGTSTTWTCISTGGNPEPTMSIRIGNNVFSQEVNVNSVFDQSSNTYRVTGTLAWAPQSYHNQMTIYCDVEQPETMDRPQTVSLPLTVITSPKNPVLRGPSTVEAGKQYTWTCTSSGANPEQTMSMRLGNNAIQDGLVTDSVYNTASKLYTMTGTLTWTPSGNNHEDTLFCDVFHTQTLGQTPQTASLQLLVQTQPNKPTLTGPTTVTAGSSNTWTCLSIGGNPEPEMSIRINDRVFSQEVTVNSVYDQSSKSFRTTGTLTWAPSSRFNLETLYCDVLHEETSDRVQTVNLPLTVISPPNNPVLSGPTTIKAGAQDTWTCTSTGAYPEQTMSMRLGGNAITSGFATTAVYNGASKTYTVTGTLSWSPASSNNGDVLYCDVFHTPTLGNSPQTASLTLNVQNSPQRPQLSGPTTVTAGSSNTWTCTSVGGNPEPTMSIRYENQVFNNEVTFSSNYDDTSKSFRVTGTLAWAPSSIHNLQSLYCDVYHPETLGSTPQTVNLALTVLSPPRPPVLTGPTTVRAGTQSKWTCTSVGAYPEQSMSMRIGNSDITQGFYTNTEYNAMTKQYMVVGTLEWAPTSTNQGETLFCDVTHQETLGQTPQTASLQLSVQSSPQRPTLTGPTTTISGTSYTWTCVSTGGNPEAAMSMRVGNRVFANEVQVNSVFDQTSRSYRVTGTLSWTPASSFNGETLYCDVTHDTLGDRVQTVTLPLVVYTPPSPPQLSGPTTVTSGQSNTWTCVSNGAYPEQKMSMRIGTTTINSGITYNAVYDSIQKLYKVTGTLVWSPATNNNGDTLFCDVTHTETSGQTQTDSLDLTIYTTPQLPLLTGPTKMVAGTSLTWSCVSIGGFPQQQMSMRIGSTDLSNFLTINAVYDANTKLYRVTGTLAWAPSISHDGEVLSCDVYHQQTLGNVPQTASLRELDVQAAIDVTVPRTNYAPKEDDDVTLDCVVSSGVATSVTWYKDNVALQVASTERYSGATPNSPSLTISKVTLNDRGNYVCGATDGMSTDQSATVFVQPVEKVWTEHVIITYILDGYNKLVRPQDPLVNVTHNLVPRHFLHFDGRNLTVQAMQCMKWNDPRLTWPKGQNKVSLPASEIWTPDVVLLGEKYIPDFSTKVSVTKAGNVIYCPQGPIMASDCQEKSGEVHECAFKFLSWSYDLVMLDIRLPPNRNADSLVDLSMFVEHDTYEITSRCGVRNEMTYSCRDGTYAELTYSLVVRRRRQFCRNFNENPVCN